MTFWIFLSVAVISGVTLLVVLISLMYKQNMKKLEIESLKIQKANLQTEVEEAVKKQLGEQLSRIAVLEAIVTDKNYDLNEKITRLK